MQPVPATAYYEQTTAMLSLPHMPAIAGAYPLGDNDEKTSPIMIIRRVGSLYASIAYRKGGVCDNGWWQ